MSTAVRTAAATLIANGFAVQPIKPGQKVPTAAGWSTRSATVDDFHPGDSVCILTGWPSDNLVCVDLDSTDAVANADQFLPPTPMTAGRPGKPNSHRYYRVNNIPPEHTGPAGPNSASARAAAALGRHPGPRKVAFKDAAGKVIVEMLGSGQQVVCPPSVHPSGEVRTWADDTMPAPSPIDFTALLTAVQALAAACGWQPVECAGYTPQPPNPVGRCDPIAALDGDGLAAPLSVRVERCGDYLDSIPVADLSRTGQGGQDECYRVARLIVNDFAVSDRDAALSLFRRYNERLRTLNDAWTEDELRHKLDAALTAPRGGDYGDKLVPLAPQMAWDNPKRLADEFLHRHTVRCLHSTPFLYDAGHYRPLGKDEFTGVVRLFAEQQAVAEHTRRTTAWAAKDTSTLKPADQEKHKKAKPLVPPVPRELVAATEQSIRAATQLPGTTLPGSWLANQKAGNWLSVANELLELRTRTHAPHTPDYFTLAAVPVGYAPAATCPQWDSYIRDVTEGDASKAAVLQEIAGACLDAGLPLKFFAMLTGGGDNGKSVFLNVLRFVLGVGNCAAVTLDDLTGSRFAAYGLLGKLANLVGDQGRFDSADEGALKKLTSGGDLYQFERKGHQPIYAPNTAKLLFAANTPPTFSDKSDAVWNRYKQVPFTRTYTDADKNPAMLTEEHWRAELPGILNWMLEGLCRLHTTGRFTHSPACQAASEQHRIDSDPTREFLLGRCEYTGNDKDKLSAPELYQQFIVWCDGNGLRFLDRSQQKFSKAVKRVFPKIGDSRNAKIDGQQGRRWHGLRDLTAGETVPAGGLQSYRTVTEPAPIL